MKFSKAYNLNKSQAELDFVDIELNTDIPLFIDPYAISKRNDLWSIECHNMIVDFFQRAVDAIINKDDQRVIRMFSNLHETNETHLGLSKGKPKGKGVSGKQATLLYIKLKDSSAVRTGFITELSDCELLVEGIGPDKISDITTRIIKRKLIDYTMHQCFLHNIDIKDKVASGYFWDPVTQTWTDDYFPLPVFKGQKILLVPKAIARVEFSYSYAEYYNHFILNYLKVEHLDANSSLVHTLKKGKKVVYKKDLKEKYPCSKEYIYQFSRKHPEILREYKKTKEGKLKEISDEEILEGFDHHEVAEYLIKNLKAIKAGNEDAGKYHDLMIGILEFIFYPYLIYPIKEKEIHDGRKRIDIVFTNAAADGFFNRLHTVHRIPCNFIMIECKNYSDDPENPELDQLSGRFGPNKGFLGFLVCRTFHDKRLFIQRCKDTASDQRGYIVALDDDDIVCLLSYRADRNDKEIDKILNNRFREIMMG